MFIWQFLLVVFSTLPFSVLCGKKKKNKKEQKEQQQTTKGPLRFPKTKMLGPPTLTSGTVTNPSPQQTAGGDSDGGGGEGSIKTAVAATRMPSEEPDEGTPAKEDEAAVAGGPTAKTKNLNVTANADAKATAAKTPVKPKTTGPPVAQSVYI